jgi:outer membrane protein OmpA-like peptidoglycan-associated protein
MRFLIILFLILVSDVWAQSERLISSDNIADCSGAVPILTPGKYSIQFPGNNGMVKDLDAYPSLKTLSKKNSIWCYFIAPYDGRFSLEASITSGLVQLVAFQNDEQEVCNGLYNGSSEIKRIIQNPLESTIMLSLVFNKNSLYPVDLKKDQKIMLLFNTTEKSKPYLNLNIKYEGLNGSGNNSNTEKENVKLVDIRKNTSIPALNIIVRDIETGNPVIADLTITGQKNISALYSGSDFLFTVERSGKIKIKCDAPGYFFIDKEEPLSPGTEHEIVIWLQPLGEGRSIRIDEIEFIAGSSEFTPTADIKLRRLKDFLALNSGINIEIQGHVFSIGENTNAAQKLSEARAKRVYNYLIDNGIDKTRMEYKGYGNTIPIYERPKFAYEEQANRRVEIKIK